MFVQKRQRFLRRSTMLQQLPQRAQTKGVVTKRRFASLINGFAGVPLAERQQPLQHPDSGNASRFQHRGGPRLDALAQVRGFRQEPTGSALNAADLLGRQMLAQRTESARRLTWMHGNLRQSLIEDPHQPRVPADPHGAPQILRPHRVIRFGYLDVAVTADDPLRLVEEGEPFGRQRQQRGPLDFDKHLANLFLRRPVDARVGHRRFPAEQMPVLLLQRREAARLETVVLHIRHAPLDLSLVPRRARPGRQDYRAVVLGK